MAIPKILKEGKRCDLGKDIVQLDGSCSYFGQHDDGTIMNFP